MSSSERSKLYDRVLVSQRLAGYLSIGGSGIVLALVIAWMGGYDESQKYLGGFNTNELLFNYHPVFMTAGMLCCGLSSMLTYRVLNLPKTSFTKPLHGLLHGVGVILLSLGLYSVFESNNNKDKNPYDSYYANLATVHSFTGLTAVILYGLNFVLGFAAYLMGWVDDDTKREYMPFHVFIGFFSLILVFMAIQTGIMDLWRELGCDYLPDEPDTNPAENYDELPIGCRVGNAAGIFLLVTAFFAFYALIDLRKDSPRSSATDSLLDNNKA